MRIAPIMTTKFEKRLVETGVQFLFPWVSSAILNRSADYRSTSSPRLAALDISH